MRRSTKAERTEAARKYRSKPIETMEWRTGYADRIVITLAKIKLSDDKLKHS